MKRRPSPKSLLSGYLAGQHGAAAVEFTIWVIVLLPAVMSAVDFGFYVYGYTQTSHAAQSAANAARATFLKNQCSLGPTDTLSACSGLTTATSNALAPSSVLGSTMSKISGTETILYYCGASGQTAAFTTTHSSCASDDGYYYDVKVSYSYKPIFAGASVVGVLQATPNCPTGTAAATICQEARIRLQ